MISRVISVMLPPMAIFFPLFTLLEDFGYLPRVAFNLDNLFRHAGTCGKQCLTMMMGFGCNACGVTGCRIIQSEREKLIAILTNSFTPCTGKFPTLIALISIFFAFSGSFISVLILTGLILISVMVTLLISKTLSGTLLRGVPSTFMLELPPYRVPRVGEVIIRSVLDRTLKILMRAVYAAAPAGILLWLLANIKAGDASLLTHMTGALDPFGRMLGVDGVIITAFILGFPANETVIPIMLMSYAMSGTIVDFESLAELHGILAANGWTITTAVCTMFMTLFHFPCATTVMTIRKETGSRKWTLIAFMLPAVTGIILCFLLNLLMSSVLSL